MEQVEYRAEIEAEYELERAIRCPCCKDSIQTLHAVRMLRTRVNFTSNLPRRGCIIVCPSCDTPLPAVIGTRIGI